MCDGAVLDGRTRVTFKYFIDLEKVYDIVTKDILWKALEKKRLELHILELSKICIKDYQLVCGYKLHKHTIFPL